MRILSRYFLTSYLGLFVLVLIVSLMLMTVVEMLVNFDDIVEHREAAGGVFQYLFVRVPALYFRDVVPVASFVAAFLSLGLAARTREITAMKTGGVPPARVALPLLVAATLLAGAALAANETVLLGATREFNRFENPAQDLTFRRGSFWYHRGAAFYNVREADPEKREMHGVTVFSLNREGRLLETLAAEHVTVQDDDTWIFKDATLRRFDPADITASPAVEHIDERVFDTQGAGDFALLDAGEQTLSLPQILEVIDQRTREGHEAQRYRALLHERLAEPITVLVFALLALPVGLSVESTRSMAISALAGIGLLAAFQAVWHVATIFGQSGFETAAVAPWLVLASFSGVGGILLARSPR